MDSVSMGRRSAARAERQRAFDEACMASLAAFTARSMLTDKPRPFGAQVVHGRTGKLVVRALNAVRQRCDPTAHAEVQAIRLATRRLKNISLARSNSGQRAKRSRETRTGVRSFPWLAVLPPI
jgi:tRNA(Arg) A34 adenosine deaminase TadA